MGFTRQAGVLVVALGLLVGLAGCTGSTGTAPPDPPPASPSESLQTSSASDPTSGAPSPSASVDPSGTPSGSAGPSEPPAGTRTITLEGRKVTLTVYPVRRSGTLSVLDFALSRPPAEPGEEGDRLTLSTQFDDKDSSSGARNTYSVDGVRLVDTSNRKAYLVASDARRNCLCTEDINLLGFQPGQTYPFFATFATPPPGVTEVEVSVPLFGTIPRVPVT